MDMRQEDATPANGKNGHYIIKTERQDWRGKPEHFHFNDVYYDGRWILSSCVGGPVLAVVQSCQEMSQNEIERRCRELDEELKKNKGQ